MIDYYKHYCSFSIVFYKNHLYISNYKSILDINENEVIISNDEAIVKVYGSNIKAVKLLDNEILLDGSFKRIDLNE